MRKRTLQIILSIGPLLSGGYVWGMVTLELFTPYMLIWPALCLHQFEEYVATEKILGEGYFLLDWLYEAGYELTPKQVFLMDVCLGWTGTIAVGLLPPVYGAVGVCLILFFAWNGVWHASLTSHLRSWSPGTLTGLLFYLPLAYVLATRAASEGAIDELGLGGLALAAFAAHHAFLAQFPRSPEHDGARRPH